MSYRQPKKVVKNVPDNHCYEKSELDIVVMVGIFMFLRYNYIYLKKI